MLIDATSIYYVAAFVFGASITIALYYFLAPSLEIWFRASKHERAEVALGEPVPDGLLLDTARPRTQEKIKNYYDAIQRSDKNSIQFRLIRAGFFGSRAIIIYYVMRIFGSILVFASLMLGLSYFMPGLSFLMIFMISMIFSALVLVGSNLILDRMGKKQEERYRRAFPDFIDMMIMCAEAGLNLEAATARVAIEFLNRHSGLGVHLSVMMLEVRAGKRLNDALGEMADRLSLQEARSLAMMFRQSEELGASIVETLRVFGADMRSRRLIRAEEKALALPVKMVFPMGLFMFPVILAIVIIPALVIVMRTVTSVTP